MIKVIKRAEWGAKPPNGRFTQMHSPEGVIVHHSADPFRRSSGAVQQIQIDHQSWGWVDVGYNFLITEVGEICEGRPEVDGLPAIGSYSSGADSRRIGICLLGNFQEGHDHVDKDQLAALVKLCRWCAIHYSIQSLLISGHRDHRTTACPGDQLYRLLDSVRADVLPTDSPTDSPIDEAVQSLMEAGPEIHIGDYPAALWALYDCCFSVLEHLGATGLPLSRR